MDPSSSSWGRRPLAPLASAALAALILSSCFTSMLWQKDDVDDGQAFAALSIAVVQASAAEGLGCPADEGDDDDGDGLDLAGRLCLTPVALLLDLVTWPFQRWWLDEFGDEDEGDG